MKFLTLCRKKCRYNGDIISMFDLETGKVIIRYVCKKGGCKK